MLNMSLVKHSVTDVHVVIGFNHEAHNAPAYKFNTTATFVVFRDLDFLSGTDILAVFLLRMFRNWSF